MVLVVHLPALFILVIAAAVAVTSLPVVDKGVFVITGVKTCGQGQGYCVLGGDCSVDKEFTADTSGGHCDGLRKAFTPRAYFVCCEYVDAKPTTTTTTTTTPASTTAEPDSVESSPELNDSSVESKESVESPESPDSDESINKGQLAVTTIAATPATSTTLKPGLTTFTILDSSSNGLVLMDESTAATATEKTTESTTVNSQRNDIEEDSVRKTEGTTTVINEALNDDLLPGTKTPVQQVPTTVETTENNLPVQTTPSQQGSGKPVEGPVSVAGTEGNTTPVDGLVRDKDNAQPATTIISYSEKTEISMEQSVSLHVKQCGVKLFSSRFDSPRLATQGSSGSPSSCWTGAVVRSPSTLTMQADPGSFLCAGALIHPAVFLTTATCVSRMFSQDLSLFKIALGSGHLIHPANGPTPDADYRDIKELVIHEDYVVDGHLRINDIALVMLSEPADMTKACTLCLPDEHTDFTGRDCAVTGYSHPSDSSGLESDGILHEADQRIEYHATCETVLTNFTQHSLRTEKDLQGLLCASGKYSAEACFSPRDAGSPLACAENGIYVLAGSFSSGFHCGTPEMPVLYTDIARQMSWVNKNLLKTFVAF